MLMLLSAFPAEGGGFNPLDLSHGGGMLWTWIIFGASMPFIWKVVMGPVSRALLERDERAVQAIAAAERASREAAEARAAVELRLNEAQVEASRLLEAARARAEVRERELLDEAKRESAVLLEHARAEIKSEQDKAVATIRKQVVDVSLKAAGQVLRRRVDTQDDRRLVEELVSAANEVKS